MDVLKVTKNAGTVVVLPAPAEIKWSISDLDGDGSREEPKRGPVPGPRGGKAKDRVLLAPNECRKNGNAFVSRQRSVFQAYIPRCAYGTNRTITCYVGDRSAPILRPEADGTWLWGEMSMNFIER